MPIEMVRPDWNVLIGHVHLHRAYVMCNCGHVLQTQEETREHWQRGHFDYVLVKTGTEAKTKDGQDTDPITREWNTPAEDEVWKDL